MGKFADISGYKFGRLTVIEKSGSHKKGYALWLCCCECGETTIVRSDKLKSGNTMSCGCLMSEKFSEKKVKHGLSKSPIYTVWRGMKSRCYNKNHVGYKNYGGRGIEICDEWKEDFERFYIFCVKNKWRKGLEIDRINNNGNYEPSNCRFVTPSENNKNKRNNNEE